MSKEVEPGTSIHVIACFRGLLSTGNNQESVFGVRWAARPDLGFPSHGFVLHRVLAGTPMLIGRFFLPPSTDWLA
jgi:hypothetical protein